MDATPLFRAAAIAEQQDRLLGTVLVVPRVSQVAVTLVVAVVVGGILSLLVLGEYTRKARLGGWVVPQDGLISVVPPHVGVLTRLDVDEGRVVRAGERLAVLSTDRSIRDLGPVGDRVVAGLAARRDSQREELARQAELLDLERQTLARRIEVTAAEIDALAGEAAIQAQRVALAEQEFGRQRTLRERGITRETELREAEAESLEQKVALQTLERSRAELERQEVELAAALAENPLRKAVALAAIERAVAELDQQLAEAEAAREVVITAPQDGMVTALTASAGSSVGPDAALLTMVPVGARLEARLYAPSRAVGFLRSGQRVLVRYAAFPYQKFGQYGGTVQSVSRATVGPAELGDRATVLSDLVPGEPVYRVSVALDADVANAYGEEIPLQPGMQLEADIAIDTRKLYEWVLDPIISLAGRAA